MRARLPNSLDMRVFRTRRSGRMAVVLTALVCVLPQWGVARADYPQESFRVNSAQDPALGDTPSVLLEKGHTYRVIVSGTYIYHTTNNSPYVADAECSIDLTDSQWVREGYPDASEPATRVDSLDLMIDGLSPDWVPVLPKGEATSRRLGEREALGCNTIDRSVSQGIDPYLRSHVYEVYLTPDTTKTYNFAILDDPYTDNSGSLDVRIELVTSLGRLNPIKSYVGVAMIDSKSDPSAKPGGFAVQNVLGTGGFTPAAVITGRRYLILASGVYLYSQGVGPRYLADAECATTDADFVWRDGRFTEYAPDLLDLLVSGSAVTWMPAARPGTTDPRCDDPSHIYAFTYVPMSNDTLTFRVNERDGGYGDNTGYIFVQVFELET